MQNYPSEHSRNLEDRCKGSTVPVVIMRDEITIVANLDNPLPRYPWSVVIKKIKPGFG